MADAADAADKELQKVLGWLRTAAPDESYPHQRCFYAIGPCGGWDRAAIGQDLWRRACGIARHGTITEAELQIWGHWYGVGDGYRWPQAEIRSRFHVGRDYATRSIGKVTGKVAQTLRNQPPAAMPPIGRGEIQGADLQEAGATVISRAVAEGRHHQAEIYNNMQDLLRAARVVPAAGRVRPAGYIGRPKHNLKTTRHAAASLSEWHRAILDAAARRLRGLSDPELPYLPLWRPADPVTDNLEQTYLSLQALYNGRERGAIAQVLRDGHHQMAHATADRDLMIEFLLLEVAILRDSYNITALPVLDVLEYLVPAGDHRRVILARERAHLLEVHHLWSAAERWLMAADTRLKDPRVRWPSPDDKRLNAVNTYIRLLSVRIDQSMASGEIPRLGPSGLLAQIRALLDRMEQNPASLNEWRHLVRRHDIQWRLAVKGIERRHGIGTAWDDDDFSRLARVDREVAGLRAPARVLAWDTRKLSVLLEADRRADFLLALRQAIPRFEHDGPAWPNQIAALRLVLESALRRRRRPWIAARNDVHDLLEALPDDTDDMLRHQLAIPRPLIIYGTPVF